MKNRAENVFDSVKAHNSLSAVNQLEEIFMNAENATIASQGEMIKQ